MSKTQNTTKEVTHNNAVEGIQLTEADIRNIAMEGAYKALAKSGINENTPGIPEVIGTMVGDTASDVVFSLSTNNLAKTVIEKVNNPFSSWKNLGYTALKGVVYTGVAAVTVGTGLAVAKAFSGSAEETESTADSQFAANPFSDTSVVSPGRARKNAPVAQTHGHA